MERIWFRSRFKPDYQYLVQTEHMREAFKNNFPDADCLVQPFFDLPTSQVSTAENSFIYVSSTDTHKNQPLLIEAMGILARDGIKPKLKLVFNQNENQWLVDIANKTNLDTGSRIETIGPMGREDLISHYQMSSCLIFPSKFESFGLPLLEAQALGLDIIASEMDYVRELVEPVQSFDPSSAKSIARAIQRYLNLPSTKTRIISSREFLKAIC